jgi:hypothetical protein
MVQEELQRQYLSKKKLRPGTITPSKVIEQNSNLHIYTM